jgi:hypothetical protein
MECQINTEELNIPMSMSINSSEVPLTSIPTNQTSVQTPAMNSSVVEGQNVPNTPQAPTNNLEVKNFILIFLDLFQN